MLVSVRARGPATGCRSAPVSARAPQVIARAPFSSASAKRRACIARAIGIFFSTSTGHTEEVAGMIKEALGAEAAEPKDIGDVSNLEELKKYDGLVVGAPTWNTGADDGRSGTSWDDVLSQIAALKLNGKPVACFGCGDSISYSEYFCDAMEELYSTFAATGATMVGQWPSKGYNHHESKAETEPGWFCGLALDQDNEADLSEKRIKEWTAQVLSEMKAKV